MIKIEKTLTLKANPAATFAFVTDPARMSEALGGIFEASMIPESPLKNDAHFNFKYRLGDSILTGVWTVKKLDPPSLYIAETKGLTTSTWTHEISEHGNGSLLKLTFEYKLPTGLLNSYQEKEIISLNEGNMDKIATALIAALNTA